MSEILKDRSDFKKVFDEYYSALCNFAYKYTGERQLAEDMVQNVFVKLWEKRDSLELTGSLKSYLFTATRNAALDQYRKTKRKRQLLEEQKPVPHEDAPIDDVASKQLFREKLYRAINDLKPKTKKIFMLHKMEGLTYVEISEHLGIPKRTVEYNVYSALAQLKEKLKDDYEKYLAA